MIYRKLNVWIKAKELAVEVYKLIRGFPSFEKYGMVSQLARSAVSVASNLAEGCSRSSAKEQVHYIEIAYGSLLELCCQIEISRDLVYLSSSKADDILMKAEKLAVMLSNYKKTKMGRKAEGS